MLGLIFVKCQNKFVFCQFFFEIMVYEVKLTEYKGAFVNYQKGLYENGKLA
jgi:hypothetical protein